MTFDATLPQISLRAVSKHYRQGDIIVTAVDDVNLEVRRGDFLVITGRSGAGKTTLLSLIGGLTQPSAGTICVEGADLKSLDDAALSTLRAQKIGFIFQFASLLPTLTVLENVRLPSLFAAGATDSRRAVDLLMLVGLEDKVRNYPSQLSGGQRRRVAVARALMNQPAILLADEPTGDLDVDTEAEILDLFHSLNAQGMTIILVTHNPDLATFGNRIFRMERGRLIDTSAQGSPPCDMAPVLAFSSS